MSFEPIPRTPDEKPDLVRSIPFVLVHLVALATPFLVGISWAAVLLALALYYLRMFAITAGYHRYFSHRSFKTSRAFQFVLALLATSSAQKGVLWWAAHHRHHHRYADQAEDVHSPLKGFWWSHVGWIVSRKHEGTDLSRVKDLTRFPELVWLDRHFLVPPTALAALLLLLGGWSALLWGFFVSTVLLWHGTFFINSLAHVFGRRRYATSDTSRNSMLLALLTLGEGWHNNHHHYPSTANQGWYWWELDGTYFVLKVLSRVGVVWDLRTPTREIMERGRIEAPAGTGALEHQPA